MDAVPNQALIDDLIKRRLDELLPQKLEAALAKRESERTPSMMILASRGTLDWAYPPFILSSTAAALGWDVSVFFTFYGVQLLRKDLSHLKVSPLGNPGMPMKMPFGPDWFRGINWNMPNAVQASIPGFEAMCSMLMKKTIKNAGVADIGDLRAMAMEAGVKLIACQMTVDLFGFTSDDFLPEVKEYCGAATALSLAREADVALFT